MTILCVLLGELCKEAVMWIAVVDAEGSTIKDELYKSQTGHKNVEYIALEVNVSLSWFCVCVCVYFFSLTRQLPGQIFFSTLSTLRRILIALATIHYSSFENYTNFQNDQACKLSLHSQ